jgi:hypothetical protein
MSANKHALLLVGSQLTIDLSYAQKNGGKRAKVTQNWNLGDFDGAPERVIRQSLR